MNRPNIILIITDQQRYDTVAAVGFPHVGTRAHRPGSATTGGLHSGLSVPCRH